MKVIKGFERTSFAMVPIGEVFENTNDVLYYKISETEAFNVEENSIFEIGVSEACLVYPNAFLTL